MDLEVQEVKERLDRFLELLEMEIGEDMGFQLDFYDAWEDLKELSKEIDIE